MFKKKFLNVLSIEAPQHVHVESEWVKQLGTLRGTNLAHVFGLYCLSSFMGERNTVSLDWEKIIPSIQEIWLQLQIYIMVT